MPRAWSETATWERSRSFRRSMLLDGPRRCWKSKATPRPLGESTRACWATPSVLYDLGTHAHQLTRFITGLEVTEVAAELSQIVAGRAIKDNANCLLRFSNGARGTLGLRWQLWATSTVTDPGLWRSRQLGLAPGRSSCHLLYSPIDGPPQILAQGAAWLSPDADKWTRADWTSRRFFRGVCESLY